MFMLDPILQKDTFTLGQFELCRLLLMNDSSYPWFILVPQVENIREMFELPEPEQIQVLRESSQFSAIINNTFNADKLNIAALGNVSPQLHFHHIVRYKNDPAWPAPIWGKVPMNPYTDTERNELIEKLKLGLTANFNWA